MTTEQIERIAKTVAKMSPEEKTATLSYFIYRLMSPRLNENEGRYCDGEKLGFMSEALDQTSQGAAFEALSEELDEVEDAILERAAK